jgi:chromosome partitioning protein
VILVPVTPSVFDMDATRELLETLSEYKSVREGGVHIGLVGNRVHTRFRSAAELDAFMDSLGFPFLADLRDTQVYIHSARDGLSIFDLPPSRGEQDREQWRPITRWLAKKLA